MTDSHDRDGEQESPAAASDAFELLGEIPRRAAEQASTLIGRLIQAMEPEPERDRLATGESRSPDPDFAQLRGAFGRAFDLYLDLFQRTLDSYMEMIELASRRRGLSVTAREGGGVELEQRDDASHATGALYVHNYSGDVATIPDVRITDLTAANGTVVPASAIRVDFAADEGIVEDRATVRVDVSVDLRGADSGVYFGHALSGPDAVPVRLTVPGS